MTRIRFTILVAPILLISLSHYSLSLKIEEARAFSSFGGTAAGISSVPVTVVADIPYSIKEQVEDVAARAGAKMLQAKLQGLVWEKIKSAGRDSSPGATGPAFVRDWRDFLQGGQYRGEDIFRAILADAAVGQNATICDYLRKPISETFGATTASLIDKFVPSKYRVDSLQYFKIENRCTLPADFDVEKFKEDFRNGGWEAFQKLSEPQNNIFGLYANSATELVKQRGFEEKIDSEEAVAGSGFTSRRANCQGRGSSLRCVVLGDVQTPGEILQQTIQRSIDEDFSWVTSADEFSELLAGLASNLLGAMLDKLDNLAKGIPGQAAQTVFDIQSCINECTISGYRNCDLLKGRCEGAVEPELSACLEIEAADQAICRDNALNTCRRTCAQNEIGL